MEEPIEAYFCPSCGMNIEEDEDEDEDEDEEEDEGFDDY
jgi:hypothetical protein